VILPQPPPQEELGDPVAALLYLADLPPDKLLTVEQVLTLIPISISTWRRGVRSGRFPPGVRLTARSVFWRVDAIRAMPTDDQDFDLGEVTDAGSGSTPLGDAAPFEYAENATSDDVLSMAARGFGESVEADCFGDYETNLDMCNALAGHIGGVRAIASCKQNAFAKYQTCRGF
jgi:predicted DNA-binding transcriptional regulator AlpA